MLIVFVCCLYMLLVVNKIYWLINGVVYKNIIIEIFLFFIESVKVWVLSVEFVILGW